jgi:carbon storage regulator
MLRAANARVVTKVVTGLLIILVLGCGPPKITVSGRENWLNKQGSVKMLVLSRKVGEKIVIGDNIVIEVVRVKGKRVTIGLVAPTAVPILRGELNRTITSNHSTEPASSQDDLLVAV